MTLDAVSDTSVLLPVGGLWLLEVETRDLDGRLVAATPAVAVTKPDGSTVTPAPTFESVSAGSYRATYTAAAAGRHIAHVTTTDDAVDFAAYVAAATTAGGMPNVNDVAQYLGASASSWTQADLQDALDAEAAAQRSVCRVAAVYPADLRQALLRRVQRNLAMRKLPLGVNFGDADAGSLVLPGRDPEVRRLESPYRRVVFG